MTGFPPVFTVLVASTPRSSAISRGIKSRINKASSISLDDDETYDDPSLSHLWGKDGEAGTKHSSASSSDESDTWKETSAYYFSFSSSSGSSASSETLEVAPSKFQQPPMELIPERFAIPNKSSFPSNDDGGEVYDDPSLSHLWGAEGGDGTSFSSASSSETSSTQHPPSDIQRIPETSIIKEHSIEWVPNFSILEESSSAAAAPTNHKIVPSQEGDHQTLYPILGPPPPPIPPSQVSLRRRGRRLPPTPTPPLQVSLRRRGRRNMCTLKTNPPFQASASPPSAQPSPKYQKQGKQKEQHQQSSMMYTTLARFAGIFSGPCGPSSRYFSY